MKCAQGTTSMTATNAPNDVKTEVNVHGRDLNAPSTKRENYMRFPNADYKLKTLASWHQHTKYLKQTRPTTKTKQAKGTSNEDDRIYSKNIGDKTKMFLQSQKSDRF